MFNFMRCEYRIVEDSFGGFAVETRRWWFPFWVEWPTNTHNSVERATRFAEAHAKGCVVYLGRYPKASCES